MNARVILYGVGAIGLETARAAAQRRDILLVGAIDTDPEKAGRDLGDLTGVDSLRGIAVSDQPAQVPAGTGPLVALLTTSSRLEQVFPQLEQLARAGVNVVSSCEELSFPWYHHPDWADRIHRLAQSHNVRILGTGVNPGFVLDELVVTMASVCSRVTRIEARRILDAGKRREPLQKKVGAGMAEAEFRDLVGRNALGHLGLAESVAYVAEGMGWKLDSISESTDPVISDRDVQTPYVKVSKGEVAGLRMIAVGKKGDAAVITLELQMYVGARRPVDEIYIEGEPSLRTRIPRGIPGDIATVAKLINSIPRVLQGEPGLLRPRS
ncbi:MAG: dihydrodipicolinate reductase, partial [Dehalococcoidia bacterium]